LPSNATSDDSSDSSPGCPRRGASSGIRRYNGLFPSANCAVVETASLRFTVVLAGWIPNFPPPGPCLVPLFSQHHSKISLPLFYLRNTQLSEEGAVPIRCSQFLPLKQGITTRSTSEQRSAPREVREHDAQKIHHDQDQRPRARRTRTRTDGKPPTPDDRTGVPTTQADERPN
jgi:hypothetical protein